MKDNAIKTSRKKFDPVEILSRDGADRAYSATEFSEIAGYQAQVCTRYCRERVESGELISKRIMGNRCWQWVYALNTEENVLFLEG